MESSASQVYEISCINKLINPDESLHLKCYKQHVYSYMSAMGFQAEILFYCAIEPTRKLYEFAYHGEMFKWRYESRYMSESDWFKVGLYAERAKVEFDFDDFIEMAKQEIKRNHPVLFYAPRIDVPYFRELAPTNESRDDILEDLHSFLICGFDESKGTIKFYESAFGKPLYESRIADIKENYLKHKDHWFADAYALYHVDKVADYDDIYEKHLAYMTGYQDDLYLYDVLAERVESEFFICGTMYDRPFLNAVSLLYGTRLSFNKFLRLSGYKNDIVMEFEKLTLALRKLDTDSHKMIVKEDATLIDPVIKQILNCKNLEEKMIEKIKSGIVRKTEWDIAVQNHREIEIN